MLQAHTIREKKTKKPKQHQSINQSIMEWNKRGQLEHMTHVILANSLVPEISFCVNALSAARPFHAAIVDGFTLSADGTYADTALKYPDEDAPEVEAPEARVDICPEFVEVLDDIMVSWASIICARAQKYGHTESKLKFAD
jgi:hypothetical protein